MPRLILRVWGAIRMAVMAGVPTATVQAGVPLA